MKEILCQRASSVHPYRRPVRLGSVRRPTDGGGQCLWNGRETVDESDDPDGLTLQKIVHVHRAHTYCQGHCRPEFPPGSSSRCTFWSVSSTSGVKDP